MAYRVYSGAAATQEEYLKCKPKWSWRNYSELDDALGFALRMENTPNRAWEIEGDDGTHFSRSELIRIFRERGVELVGRPKVF
jgi:hypothetical protein